jgi:hypothetical protein
MANDMASASPTGDGWDAAVMCGTGEFIYSIKAKSYYGGDSSTDDRGISRIQIGCRNPYLSSSDKSQV